jgi:hypothetical protein
MHSERYFYWGRCGAHPEGTVKWKLDYLPREKWRYLANFERVQFAAIR